MVSELVREHGKILQIVSRWTNIRKHMFSQQSDT